MIVKTFTSLHLMRATECTALTDVRACALKIRLVKDISAAENSVGV